MRNGEYRIKVVKIAIPGGANVILGQSHFIKTAADLYETLVTSSTALKFGLAFCEASGKRLVRSDGNDPDLVKKAEQAAFDIGCGHSFVIYLTDGFPVNVLNQVKQVSEVCSVYCATANPLEVVVLETTLGRGVLGVVDGEPPLGIETVADKVERKQFLEKIGYKR